MELIIVSAIDIFAILAAQHPVAYLFRMAGCHPAPHVRPIPPFSPFSRHQCLDLALTSLIFAPKN